MRHFTNGINAQSTPVLNCANTEKRENGGTELQWGWWAAMDFKQMALVLLSARPSGVYLNWWLHHQSLAHQPTMALITHVYTFVEHNHSCTSWKVYAWARACAAFAQILTVRSTRPVKMSHLYLLSFHSEWLVSGISTQMLFGSFSLFCQPHKNFNSPSH